jgi:hypothetical protein
MTPISKIKNSERKKIQRRIQERLTKKGSKKSSSKRKTVKKSSIKNKKVNKIPPPSKKQINGQIRYIDNILSQDGLHLDSNEKNKLEFAFKNFKFDKYYQPHFIPGGEKTVKDGKKINWQKSIDAQLDDKINLFIKDGGLRDPDRINALIEEIS